MIDDIKNKFLEIKQKIYSNPKKFYTYTMILLTASFIFSMIQSIFFQPKIETTTVIPSLFRKSDRVIREKEENKIQKQKELQKIVSELQELKFKRENLQLTKADSIRIEYLYNQYQIISNEN